MTQGTFNGTNLLTKVIGSGGTLATLGHTQSCTISLNQDLPDITTKDSGGWSESLAGLKGGSISFDGLVAYDDAANQVETTDYLINGTLVDWSFGTEAAGDFIYTGSGRVDSIEVNADAESPVSYSGSITITGAVTKLSYIAIDLYANVLLANKCNTSGGTSTYYIDTESWLTATKLYVYSAGSYSLATASYYYDPLTGGTPVRYWDGSAFTSTEACV